MPIVKPFRAVRAAVDKAAHLISRPYQEYGENELEAQLTYNPFSFLQILHPGYRYKQSITGEERYQLVRNRFLEFKEEKHLIKDEQPAFYIYEKTIVDHTFTGIIASTSVADYKNDLIKKHEDTLEPREILFKDYLKTVGFNAEPVLITYEDDITVNSIIEDIKNTTPQFNFSTTDGHLHKIWNLTDPKKISHLEQLFDKMPHFYIADGHHRTASATLLSEEIKDEKAQYFMSFLIAQSQLKIKTFNRSIRDLNGLNSQDFLIQLDRYFRIQNRGLELYRPSQKHHFSMYLDGSFYSLYLRKDAYAIDTPLADLDSQILYDIILKPLLDIQDLRNSSRIQYSYGKDDFLRLKKLCDDGEYAVSFGHYPAMVEQLKNIADADLRMPPKSTFIQPKLPSGLLIYEF